MKISKLSIVSLVSCILSLVTLFLEPHKYKTLGYTLFIIEPLLLYFVTIPLIVLSLITGIISLIKMRKETSNPLLIYLVFALYLLLIILASTILKIDIGRSIFSI